MILHLECRAIIYAEGGHPTPSPPCGHTWAETLPMPIHSRAFVARMRAACLCPRCGTSDSVYLVEEGVAITLGMLRRAPAAVQKAEKGEKA